MFYYLKVLIILLIMHYFGFSAIKSSTGNLYFDVNSNNNIEMSLSSNGLLIGSGVASANLEVTGNGIVSKRVSVGTSSVSSSANMYLSGTMSLMPYTVTTNTTLDSYSQYMVNHSAGDINLTLPSASSASGRVVKIKFISSSNNTVLLQPSGSDKIDEKASLTFSGNAASSYPSLSVLSSGANWHIISYKGDSSVLAEDSSFTASSNLIGYWKMDVLAPTDESSNSYDATVTGTVTLETGKFDSAVGYSNNANYHTMGAIPFDSFQGFSVSCWFYVPTGSHTGANWQKFSPIFGSDDNTGDGKWGFVFGLFNPQDGTTLDEGFYLNINTSAGDTRYANYVPYNNPINGYDLSLDTWHHVVFTHDVTSGSNVYVDKVIDGAGLSHSGNVKSVNLGEFKVGRVVNNNHYNGYVDDMRVYDKVLNQTEVNQIFNGDL